MEMIDVITRLREIADKSPEIEKALESASRMTAKRVDEGVQITVSGSDAVLHQILKLAGLIGAETVEAPDSLSHTSMPHDTMSHPSMSHDMMPHDDMPQPGMGTGSDHSDLEIMPEGDRPYSHGRADTYGASTSPDEIVLDFDTAIPQGSDLHGLGADGYNKVAGGGNPMRPRP